MPAAVQTKDVLHFKIVTVAFVILALRDSNVNKSEKSNDMVKMVSNN
jgi:hypothetical protein